ncbi:MAG TPA: hypothetical protein VHQ41_00885 [Patescibacteria group bacterium]|jgi:archaellum component FlaC|nr:hypothetical protein [Patescibacteria group bacterium]
MLTTADVNKLIEAMKVFFYIKEDIDKKFEKVDLKFSQLQTAVDGIAKIGKDNSEEIAALGNRFDSVENWVEKSAQKIGLEYKT